MKNFHQNLLVCFALGLCTLCAYQWYGQALQRKNIEGLTQTIFERDTAIQSYTNSIKTMDRQIAQMDARITDLKGTVKTNEETFLAQRREINKLQISSETLTNEILEYKKAVDTLETKLKDAYDGIKKQNESLKELVAKRDELIQKYNDSVKERNEVVNKYNDLVKQVEKAQGGGKAPDK
jgi:chromosome segregation ATPase